MIIEKARKTGKIDKGTNEVTKAIERGVAKAVFYASDVNPKEIVMHLSVIAHEKGIPCYEVESKQKLGIAVGIPVPTSSVAIIDADHAFGHYAGSITIQHAVKMAKKTGIGAVSVKNSTHFGAAAFFAFQANQEDCIGLAFTNGDALVKAYNSKEIFFGTNPICFTVPLEKEEPFCLDMATSQVAWNKVLNYKRKNFYL